MTKDEYIETLTKYVDDNDLEREDGLTYLDGIQEATTLARQLDEPKKVVIPQLIAKLIEGASVIYGNEPLRIAHGIVAKGTSNDNGGSWLSDVNNQKLLLNAIANGYEVEKEPKCYVQIKGFYRFIDSKYVNYRTSDDTFGLDSKLEASNIKTAFTKSWLKDNWSEYEAYNNAGLLEFEEVED